MKNKKSLNERIQTVIRVDGSYFENQTHNAFAGMRINYTYIFIIQHTINVSIDSD